MKQTLVLPPSEYLNCKQLAARLGFSPPFVTAMRRAGYQFLLPGNRTTLADAVAWLTGVRQQFVARHYLVKGWESRPKLGLAGRAPVAETSGGTPLPL